MPKQRKDAPHTVDGLPVAPPNTWGNYEVNVGADYSDEEREFAVAMERFRRERKRPYPTCRETLLVLKSLGYRRPDATPEGQTVQPGGMVTRQGGTHATVAGEAGGPQRL